jgi:hypothetical protein
MNCRGGNFRDHMSAQDLKVFCTHCPTMAATGYVKVSIARTDFQASEY